MENIEYLLVDLCRVTAAVSRAHVTELPTSTPNYLAQFSVNNRMVPNGLRGRKVDLDFYLHRVFRKKSFR